MKIVDPNGWEGKSATDAAHSPSLAPPLQRINESAARTSFAQDESRQRSVDDDVATTPTQIDEPQSASTEAQTDSSDFEVPLRHDEVSELLAHRRRQSLLERKSTVIWYGVGYTLATFAVIWLIRQTYLLWY